MSAMSRTFIAGLMLTITLTGCNRHTDEQQSKPTVTNQVGATAGAPISTIPPKPSRSPAPPDLPDLSQSPLYWFGPLPPMPTSEGRPFTGSDDYMALFEQGAPWDSTAEQIQVFKLYGEWVAYHATDAQLRQAVEGIRARGMALAVEAGPLNASAECGQGIEGFAGSDEGRLIARRIKAAGGNLDLIALDEPYYYAHFYDGPNACSWSAERVAEGVDAFIQIMRAEFPDVLIGDTEPVSGPAGGPEYQAWLGTFREVAGYDLAFLHLDIDWSRPGWSQEVAGVEAYGRGIGVPIGLIYTGNFHDASDEAWLSIAGERVKRHELETGGAPDQVLFQSWNDKPDHALPESERYSFTGFIRAYFEDKSELGFRSEGRGANLAFKAETRVSRIWSGYGGEFAVDGDPGTVWNSGDDATQWIEIDLGGEVVIVKIRLIASQYPEGATRHQVYARGESGEAVLVHEFSGYTADGDQLEYVPEVPLEAVRFLRIVTVSSPSWVGWREIELLSS
jgi:hypothetical protein